MTGNVASCAHARDSVTGKSGRCFASFALRIRVCVPTKVHALTLVLHGVGNFLFVVLSDTCTHQVQDYKSGSVQCYVA